MDKVMALKVAISNAAQSLNPMETLTKVKNQAEEELKIAAGYEKDKDNGKWIKVGSNMDVELNYEIIQCIRIIDDLVKYFINRTNEEPKKFNKYFFLANVRELLKYSNIKIGQIEKEAGLQNGYTSRLEKLDNATEPSIEFIVTASRMLKVSIDALVNYDFHTFNKTELYLLTVIEKLRADTINNKLEWETDSADYLNRGIRDAVNIDHPLFETNTALFDEDMEYPVEHTITTFPSKAFGPTTEIAGDCYHLRLKNYSNIYVMDIKRLLARNTDLIGASKEIWLISRNGDKECLVSVKNFPVLIDAVERLYTEIKAYAMRPKLSQDTRKILDGFLEDDLSSDDNAFDPNKLDEIPF